MSNSYFTQSTNKFCPLSDSSIQAQLPRSKRYSTFGTWSKTNLTLQFSNYAPRLSITSQESAIQQACSVWSEQSLISIKLVTDYSDYDHTDISPPDITISFKKFNHGDGFKFDGKGGTLAHAFFPNSGDFSGQIHFDIDEDWKVGNDGSPNLFMVALHEIGHVLGLGHSEFEGSVMLPYYHNSYQSKNGKVKLGNDDVEGIRILYGTPGEHIEKKTENFFDTPMLPKIILPIKSVQKTFNYIQIEYFCDQTNFDSIAIIRNELFLFKNYNFWRITEKHGLMQEEGTLISTFFLGFPASKKLDACYERDRHGGIMSPIVLISGNKYYLFDQTKIYPGYPKRLNKVFPKFQKGFKVKFAFRFGAFSYVFGEDGLVYKYREEDRSLNHGYPMRMGDWFDSLRFVRQSGLDRVDRKNEWAERSSKDLFKNLQASYINGSDLFIFQGLQVFKMPINRRRHVPKLFDNNFSRKYCEIGTPALAGERINKRTTYLQQGLKRSGLKTNLVKTVDAEVSYAKEIVSDHGNGHAAKDSENKLTFGQFLSNLFSDSRKLEYGRVDVFIHVTCLSFCYFMF